MTDGRNLELLRVFSGSSGTVGVLLLDMMPICWTLERPWLGNKRNVSCIPEGLYEMRVSKSTGLGYTTPEVLDVPGRSGIRMHIGNQVEDCKGCILLGMEVSEHGVVSSTKAFKRLMEMTGGFTSLERLRIRSV